ncbi:MAG: hypothetical protein H7Y33_14855 [Cytophagales bacterium]|nr:hypothetical protein [Rhizobacter sp.]
MTLVHDGRACSCFPPEVRAKTAQDALASARLAVYGRVMEVDVNGKARLRVLESFKGPAVGATFDAQPGGGACETPSFSVSEEVLVLSFSEPATACDKHPPEHYLLEAFRLNAATVK